METIQTISMLLAAGLSIYLSIAIFKAVIEAERDPATVAVATIFSFVLTLTSAMNVWLYFYL